MKSKLNPVPAANRTQEKINTTQRGHVELKLDEAQKLVTGIYELDAKVKLKDSQIVTITKQKSDLQQLVTSKTSEVQTKNSLLVQKDNLINQKTTELQSKDSLLLQKEQLLSELRIKEENQLKEEYISVLHQLNPKVFSANYEDWSGKAQGFKDIIDQGKFKTIRKKLPVYKQQLAQKIETEKLALATKEAERLDNAKQEVVSILNQLHPTLYPANFEEWSTHPPAQSSNAKRILDSNNLGAIEKKLVHYRELLKQEVQNKALLILQKEQEFKSLNDTFTIKEEEIITKSQLLSQSNTKVKKVSRKLAQEVQSKNQLALQKELEKEEIRIQKEQEIERLRELLAQKDIEIQNKDLLRDELLTQKELENQEKERLREELARKELEKQELLIQKEREKEELLAQRDKELQELEKVNNDVLIKEFIEILPQRYPDLYPKNFAEWPHDIWGKQVVDGNDIEAIKHYLPIYRKEVIENLNQLILTERAKIEELLVEKANVQQKLIDKDNLLSDQTEDIERINVLLETKGIIIQRLEQEKEILQTRHDILDMKMQLTVKEFTVREREKDKALLEKDTELKKLAESSKLLADYQEEMLKFKELCKTKEAEIKEKDELLAQKEVEKAVLVDDLQEKLLLKDSEILGLKMMVSEMDLAGDYQLEHLND